MKNLSTTLMIDGDALESDLASTMYQSCPFPGGHTYELKVRVSKEMFSFLAPGVYQNVNEDIASEVLGRLTRQLRSRATRPPDYLLNSVDHLTVSGDYVLLLKGTCSQFLP